MLEGDDEKKASDRDDESRQIPVVRRGIMSPTVVHSRSTTRERTFSCDTDSRHDVACRNVDHHMGMTNSEPVI